VVSLKTDKPPTPVIRRILNTIYIVALLSVIAGVLLGPGGGNSHGHLAIQSALMQTSRTLGLSLNQYAVDHNGHYPEGKSSTEVFQQLIDGKYITDPQIFYVSYLKMAGKVPALGNQLKSENVCWDVTCCIDSTAPNGLPVAFVTGYKITYQAGAAAVPRVPSPKRTWLQRLLGTGLPQSHFAFSYTDSSTT
jgi:hypothetical protein